MRPAQARHPGRPPAPVLALVVGGLLGLATVIISAVDAVSPAQALALALTSGVTMSVGMLGKFVTEIGPELRTAWQRGFQQGMEAGTAAGPGPSQEAVSWLQNVTDVTPEPASRRSPSPPRQGGFSQTRLSATSE